MVTKNSSNEELIAIPEIKEAIERGDVVVVDKAETSNPEFVQLFLAQRVNIGNSTVNTAQALLLGFNAGSIVRATQTVSAENAEMIENGSSLNELFDSEFALEVTDSLTPNPNYDHNPRKGRNRETKELENLVCRETGKPVYREAQLVSAGEESHTVIRTVLESQYTTKSVSRKKIVAQS